MDSAEQNNPVNCFARGMVSIGVDKKKNSLLKLYLFAFGSKTNYVTDLSTYKNCRSALPRRQINKATWEISNIIPSPRVEG